MQTAMSGESRGKAWTDTKLAVRRYSRNPSEANESQVRAACSRLRDACAEMPHAPRAYRAEEPGLAHE